MSVYRCYFRCTHKYDQSCQAKKQVQRIQEDPPLYQTTYFRHHTCKNNFLEAPEFILDITTINSKEHEPPCFSPSFPPIKNEFKEEKTSNKMNHNHSLSSDYIMSSDHLTLFESPRHMSMFSSSSLVTDHAWECAIWDDRVCWLPWWYFAIVIWVILFFMNKKTAPCGIATLKNNKVYYLEKKKIILASSTNCKFYAFIKIKNKKLCFYHLSM